MTSRSRPADARTLGPEIKPQITRPEDAEALRPFGIDMKVMMSAADTGGTFSALVAEIRPGEGPPPHLHRDREEYFHVLEGTYQLSVAGREETIGAGSLVFVPRGTVHAFKNVGGTPGKLLEWTIPGSNNPYFRAVHEMEAGAGFDPERFAEINRQFATEFVA
jgi:mannose-6-phosphate isomerase-like protein (cupin superfamily)